MSLVSYVRLSDGSVACLVMRPDGEEVWETLDADEFRFRWNQQ